MSKNQTRKKYMTLKVMTKILLSMKIVLYLYTPLHPKIMNLSLPYFRNAYLSHPFQAGHPESRTLIIDVDLHPIQRNSPIFRLIMKMGMKIPCQCFVSLLLLLRYPHLVLMLYKVQVWQKGLTRYLTFSLRLLGLDLGKMFLSLRGFLCLLLDRIIMAGALKALSRRLGPVHDHDHD